MKVKNFLSELEGQLTDRDREDNELTGQYILFVERQDTVQHAADCTGEFIVNSIIKLFQNLYKDEKDTATKVLTLLCMQFLEENQKSIKH